MLKILRDFFELESAPLKPARVGLASGVRDDEHTLQLATAVLLVEVMRADPDISKAEREAGIRALREKFALQESEVTSLFELACETSREANDYHRFTSAINRACDRAQRVRIIELMWQVAYADGRLSAHENHLMRKVASLLHVSHGDYIGAKMRAKAAHLA